MPYFCEIEDVRAALQESGTNFPGGAFEESFIETAIERVSEQIAARGNVHFYDSTAASSDLIESTPATASTVRLSVPSSPHSQRDQLFRDGDGLRYPVTVAGPYARITLPHGDVSTLTTLDVRDRSGDVTDWVSDSRYTEGRGDDYYVQRAGADSYGRTHLYIRASSIGPRRDYTDVLTVGYEYGRDDDADPWPDVRGGIAQLAAAELVVDDDAKVAIPSDGQMIAVETEADRLVSDAMAKLKPYMSPLA